MLERLSNEMGVSGDEGRIREIIRTEMEGFVSRIEVDSMGNLYGFKKGSSGKKKKIMLAAHMDEVGFMVTGFESSGEIKFHTIGGIDPRVLLAKKVLIGNEKIPGVIGVKAVHLLKKEELGKPPKVEDLRIDAGFSSEKEVKEAIHIGDYVSFDTKFEDLNGLYKGKAFDDRSGCVVLIELLKYDFPPDIIFTFTVQEEVGLRGASIAGYKISPDVAIAVEGTAAGDFPVKKDLGEFPAMGGGPVLTVMDRSIIVDRGILNHFIKTAEKNKIPYQLKRPNIGGTDAGRIHISKKGVRGFVIASPVRYIHSPVGLLKKQDFKDTIELLKKSLETIEGVI